MYNSDKRAWAGKWVMKMESFRIERADVQNVGLVAALFDEYLVFYGQDSNLAGAHSFLEERLKLEESVLLMAVSGEGSSKHAWGFTQLYPSFSSVSMQRLWILNDLFVSAEQRGHGLGVMLLESARQYAVYTGTKGLTLTTMKGNTLAQRLYEASGYVKDEDFYTYNLFYGK